MNRRGYVNETRFCQLLNSLSLYNSRTCNGVIGDDDFAHRNAYSNNGFDIVLKLLKIIYLISLERECGRDCIGGVIEDGQQGIAPYFQHASIIDFYDFAKPPKAILDTFVSQFLVLLHQQG